ncbi:MAG TPA: metallophosphoesterase, partial [Vicinamibacteria bacterium]|nr:metallophosphoesterase [Vicinamibacteria bacterium]
MSAFLLAALLQAAASPAAPPLPGLCGAPDPCQRGPRAGETAIVFLGDTGFGQGGASEWGPLSQGEVAARLSEVCPRPDLVFFLGDNVYWRGSPDLFGPRFDNVYAPLIDAEGRRVHAALGNHDVKGCQLSTQPAFAAGETCADALVRLILEDAEREAAATSPRLARGILDRARSVPAAECPSSSELAYEQAPDTGTQCYAQEALRHRPFGYIFRGGAPLRYYAIDHPGEGAGSAPAVRVLVTDSNTLRRGPGPDPGTPSEQVLEPRTAAAPAARWDRLQALWLENQLRTAQPGSWTFVAMHHPPWTPRGCAFRALGRCVGGHGDDEAVQRALFPTFIAPPAQ